VLRRSRQAAWLLFALLVTVGIFAADYLTGSEVSLSFFYLLPISIVTWSTSRRLGLIFSVFAATGWTYAYFLNRQSGLDRNIAIWNVAVELAIFLAVTLALSAVRDGMAKERSLKRQLEAAYLQLDQEMRVVGDVQRSLLPAAPPEIAGFRVAVHYQTCKHSGGDYYDFFPLERGRVGLMIADVSGNGSPAAVVMAMMRVLLHTIPRPLEPPERVLASLNQYIQDFTLREQFVTACYATLDGRRSAVTYALAGHNPPLLVRCDTGVVVEFENPSGPPLGPFPAPVFVRREAFLRPGDTVLFYTDGLTEVDDGHGELLGVDRVRGLLAELRHAAPETIRDLLIAAAHEHAGKNPMSDDMTWIVLRAV